MSASTFALNVKTHMHNMCSLTVYTCIHIHVNTCCITRTNIHVYYHSTLIHMRASTCSLWSPTDNSTLSCPTLSPRSAHGERRQNVWSSDWRVHASSVKCEQNECHPKASIKRSQERGVCRYPKQSANKCK